MSDNRKSVVVDIVSDSKKFLEGFEESIKEIEKVSKKANILGSMQDDIEELKVSTQNLAGILKHIKPDADESELIKLQNRIEKIDTAIKELKDSTKNIKLEVDEASGTDVKKIINRTKAEVLEVVDEIKEATSFLSDVFNIKTTNAPLNENLEKITSLKKQLEDYKKTQSILNKEDNTSYSNKKLRETSDRFNELKLKYEEVTSAYQTLSNKINSGENIPNGKTQLGNYVIELAKISKELLSVQDRLYDFKSVDIDNLFNDSELEKAVKRGEQIISKRILTIESRIEDLGGRTVDAINEEVTKLEVKDGKIKIPVELDKTVGKLKNTLQQLLEDIQSMVKPITVPIQLVSAYKTNTKNEVNELKEIQALQKGIDQLSDESEKKIAQSTLDKIKTQFEKELKIDIKTNISEAEKDVKRGINAIKTILKNEKISIYPEVELTEENKTKLKNDILEISKNFNIDFPVSDFEKSISNLTDETLIRNWGTVFTAIIDEVCSRIEKATGQLQKGAIEALKATSTEGKKTTFNINTKELKEILEVLRTISDTISSLNNDDITFNLNSEELKSTYDILQNTYDLLNKIFTISGFDKLEKDFDVLREKFNSITKNDGSFDARKKEIKELIIEYQRYLDMGGKQSITELTQNENSQKKLIQLYEKQIQQQKEIKDNSSEQPKSLINTTELINSLENIIKKIQEKNNEFKNEEQIVSSVVSGEVESLERLKTILKEIKTVLEEIDISNKGMDFSNITNLGQLNKIKSEKISNMSTALSDLVKNINELKLKDGNIFESLQDILKRSDELKNLAIALKASTSQIKEVNNVSKEKFAQNLLNGSEQEIKYFGKDYLEKEGFTVLSTSLKATSKGTVELIALVQDLNNEFKEYTLSTSNGADFVTVKIDEGTKSIERQAAAWKKLEETSVTPSTTENYLKNAESKIKNINPDKYMPEFAQKIRDAQEIIEKLKNDLPLDFTNQEDVEHLQKLISEIDKGKGLDINKLGNENNINNLIKKTASLLNENTGATKKVRSELRLLLEDMEHAGKVIPNSQVQEFTKRLTGLQAEMQKTGKVGRSFFDIITNKARHMSASLVAQYLSFYDLLRYAREGFEIIKEYDKALTEMNKVSDESIRTLKEFQKESFALADSVGTTAQQIQNSTADWMRLGESLEEAKQSAQDANILFNVSEFSSVDEATESLVSMSQAYKELGKGEIIDVVNNLGNNFAISTDGLATALQNSASALKTAQNDFFEAAALTTAANTVVQDPDKVGAGKLMPEYIVICRYIYILESSYIGQRLGIAETEGRL